MEEQVQINNVKLESVNMSALRGAEINPNAQLLKLVYDQHPEKAYLFPLVQALHGCWNTEPERILAFFMRDNRHLVAESRALLGLDVLDWSEPMWKYAVESDSFARFAILVMALKAPTPPRQPAAGLVEALRDKQYQVAAGYMGFYGHIVAPGIVDRWTGLYWTLYESGDSHAIAPAQFINGMMKHRAKRVWDRDIYRIAQKLSASQKIPLDTCKAHLESEADHHTDAAQHALEIYVAPLWKNYPADEVEAQLEATPLEGVVQSYEHLKEMEQTEDFPKELLQQIVSMTQTMATLFQFDRQTIAQQVVASGRTHLGVQDVEQDLARLGIGI